MDLFALKAKLDPQQGRVGMAPGAIPTLQYVWVKFKLRDAVYSK
jgi:hypothetical protein